jgi:hypothetical protein
MNRELKQHIVEGDSVNHQLSIHVMDEPGSGGANHHYEIADDGGIFADIKFQNGPIAEAGVNGITHEALLAILIDRLEGFQAGPYASANNASALGHIRGALYDLQARTRERIARGVEGTHKL